MGTLGGGRKCEKHRAVWEMWAEQFQKKGIERESV